MDNLDITWVVLGDGRRSDWVRTEIQRRGLRNVHLLGRHPLESMPAFFSQADVLLVTLRRDPVFALTIPGKLQSYLAFGKPVVAALDGEGARVVRESGAGIACPASDPVALAQAARDLYALPENARSALGECGRRYFAEHFEREMLIDRLTRWMVDLAGAGRMITRKTESQL
jgi:glycosyltransferase involved in cell wall biosynthesis